MEGTLLRRRLWAWLTGVNWASSWDDPAWSSSLESGMLQKKEVDQQNLHRQRQKVYTRNVVTTANFVQKITMMRLLANRCKNFPETDLLFICKWYYNIYMKHIPQRVNLANVSPLDIPNNKLQLTRTFWNLQGTIKKIKIDPMNIKLLYSVWLIPFKEGPFSIITCSTIPNSSGGIYQTLFLESPWATPCYYV
jgi:hypothetical protein